MIIEITRVENKHISKESLVTVPYPGLIEKLNSIIDWKNSVFPKTIDIHEEVTEVEDRNALGDNPQLKEGVSFIFEKQEVLVVDENTLGLLNSSTGILGIIRIISDYILPEYKLRKNISYLKPLELGEEVEARFSRAACKDWLTLPIFKQQLVSCDFIDSERTEEPKIRLPYSLLSFMKTLFPDLAEKSMVVKVNSPEIDIFDVTIEILPNGRIYYDEDDFADEDHVKSELLSLLAEKMN